MGFLPVVAAAISAVQQISQGLAQAAAAEDQARALEANSRDAAVRAQIAESQGRTQAAQTALDWYKQQGRQRAAQAQGGILASPTGLWARDETEERARRDEFQVGLDADLKKRGYLFDSADLSGRAAAARNRAARLGSLLGGVASFAGGVNKAYS